MQRILDALLGLIFLPFGLAVGGVGAWWFFVAVSAMGERALEGEAAMNAMTLALKGLALVAVGYWAGNSGWMRLKKALLPAARESAAPAAPGPAAATKPAPAPAAAAPAPAAPPKPAVLSLLHAGNSLRRTEADGEITLGRGSDCHLVISSPHVSRHHARITWGAGVPRLANLSQGGTSIRFKGETAFRPYAAEVALKDEGTIALSSDGEGAASRNEVIHFAVLR